MDRLRIECARSVAMLLRVGFSSCCLRSVPLSLSISLRSFAYRPNNNTYNNNNKTRDNTRDNNTRDNKSQQNRYERNSPRNNNDNQNRNERDRPRNNSNKERSASNDQRNNYYKERNTNSDRNNYKERNTNSDRNNYKERNTNSERSNNYKERNNNSERSNNYKDRNTNEDQRNNSNNTQHDASNNPRKKPFVSTNNPDRPKVTPRAPAPPNHWVPIVSKRAFVERLVKKRQKINQVLSDIDGEGGETLPPVLEEIAKSTPAPSPPPSPSLPPSPSPPAPPSTSSVYPASSSSPSNRSSASVSREARSSPRGEYLFGVHSVLAALKHGKRSKLFALYISEEHLRKHSSPSSSSAIEKGLSAVQLAAERAGLTPVPTSRYDLNFMAGGRPHNGAILDASPIQPEVIAGLDPYLPAADAPLQEPPVWVLFDRITDPQNLGNMLRTCHFFGVTGVVLSKHESAGLTPTACKAASGAAESLPIFVCTTVSSFITQTQKACNNAIIANATAMPKAILDLDSGTVPPPWSVIGLSLNAGSSSCVALERSKLGPTIVIVSSEGSGLRPGVQRHCTLTVRIDGAQHVETSNTSAMAETTETKEDDDEATPESTGPNVYDESVDSLNVSNALSIVLYELGKGPK